MKSEKLYKERIFPCLNELYLNSECIDGDTYDYDTLFKNSPYEKDRVDKSSRKTIPAGAFYISREKYEEIIAKYSKGLTYYWKFPYRSEIYPKGDEWEALQNKYRNNPDDEELKKEYEDTLEYMRRDKLWDDYYSRLRDIDKKRENKEIDSKIAKKMRDALAKEFGCYRRSHDREALSFVAAFWGPTCSKEYFERVKLYYNGQSAEGVDYSLAKSEADIFRKFKENKNKA